MTATSGKEWRRAREEGVEFVLPMGNKAILRPVPLMSHIRKGTVPDYLTPIATATVLGSEDTPLLKALAGNNIEEFSQEDSMLLLDFMDFLCRESMLSPRIVDSPEAEDEISIDDLSYEDRGFIVGIALQPHEILMSFRREQETDVGPVEDRAGDEVAAQ